MNGYLAVVTLIRVLDLCMCIVLKTEMVYFQNFQHLRGGGLHHRLHPLLQSRATPFQGYRSAIQFKASAA